MGRTQQAVGAAVGRSLGPPGSSRSASFWRGGVWGGGRMKIALSRRVWTRASGPTPEGRQGVIPARYRRRTRSTRVHVYMLRRHWTPRRLFGSPASRPRSERAFDAVMARFFFETRRVWVRGVTVCDRHSDRPEWSSCNYETDSSFCRMRKRASTFRRVGGHVRRSRGHNGNLARCIARPREPLARFTNLPELQQMFRASL